jgi:hypothetical protein
MITYSCRQPKEYEVLNYYLIAGHNANHMEKEEIMRIRNTEKRFSDMSYHLHNSCKQTVVTNLP